VRGGHRPWHKGCCHILGGDAGDQPTVRSLGWEQGRKTWGDVHVPGLGHSGTERKGCFKLPSLQKAVGAGLQGPTFTAGSAVGSGRNGWKSGVFGGVRWIFHRPVLLGQAGMLGDAGGTHAAERGGDPPHRRDSQWKGRPWRRGSPASVLFPPAFSWKKERLGLQLQPRARLENLKTFLHASSFRLRMSILRMRSSVAAAGPRCAGGSRPSRSPGELCVAVPSGGAPTGGGHSACSPSLALFSFFACFSHPRGTSEISRRQLESAQACAWANKLKMPHSPKLHYYRL